MSGPVAAHNRAGAVRPTRRPPRRSVRSAWRQYLAISPFYLVFTGFSLIPVIFTLFIGFQRWDGLGPMHFAGLQQFRFLVKDHTFWLALENTVIIWALATFPMLFLSLVLAV